jgi:hypothetical protein
MGAASGTGCSDERMHLAMFLNLTGPPRRRNEDHALALKAHSARLIAADPARV